ncbi:hypothetical protein HDU86_002039 [Geranomyces michiganensis]|nr:hypothetical protein HDU86_002039 [Geranomyces michiganensis]
MVSIIKLTYFDFRGKGEALRVALSVAGLPFVDERLTDAEWASRKESMPFGQLPVLEIDGKQLSQQQAILRYVGRLGGLYPEDQLEAATVDMFMGACDGELGRFPVNIVITPRSNETPRRALDVSAIMKPNMSEPDAEKRVSMRQELIKDDGELTLFLRKFDRAVGASGTEGHAVGTSITVADILIYVQACFLSVGALRGIPTTYYGQFTNLHNIKEKVHAHPKVQEWNAHHAARLAARQKAASTSA